MSSPAVIFDGTTLGIYLPALGTYDAKIDIYSEWKRWVLDAENQKYPVAFDTTGGDPLDATTSIDAFYFLRNDLGWTIHGPEATGEVVINGNIFPRDFNKTSFVGPQTPGLTQLFKLVVSSKALAIETSTSGLTPNESAMLNLIKKLLMNQLVTNPTTGVMSLLDDDDATVILQADIFEDVGETQPYRGRGIEVRRRLQAPGSPTGGP